MRKENCSLVRTCGLCPLHLLSNVEAQPRHAAWYEITNKRAVEKRYQYGRHITSDIIVLYLLLLPRRDFERTQRSVAIGHTQGEGAASPPRIRGSRIPGSQAVDGGDEAKGREMKSGGVCSCVRSSEKAKGKSDRSQKRAADESCSKPARRETVATNHKLPCQNVAAVSTTCSPSFANALLQPPSLFHSVQLPGVRDSRSWRPRTEADEQNQTSTTPLISSPLRRVAGPPSQITRRLVV